MGLFFVLVSLFIALSSYQIEAKFQQAGFYRDEKKQRILNGNFKSDPNRRLMVAKIASHLVEDKFECTFRCFSEASCKSFNLAVSPDSNGLYVCELLKNDKYKAHDSVLQVSAMFHHFSPWSLCRGGFVGNQCERIGESCSEIKYHNPQATSGLYFIDPDGEGGYEPFTVACDMTSENSVGVTIIGHDSETRIYVSGYEGDGSYIRDVHYNGNGVTSVEQVAVITNVSSRCEQFIKYECYHSLLLQSNTGWWVSRDHKKMIYWGGATSTEPYKCACGVTSPNSCADPTRGCNCDKNDATWREDSGLLTEKYHLPVIQLRFGDTGASSEKGYHTLGVLKCYGSEK